MDYREQIEKNLSGEVGYSVSWEDMEELVGADVMMAVERDDAAAIIELRQALGLAPFC